MIDRFKDKEDKIINELANQLGDPDPSIKGKIELFTENDTYDSCNNIIFNFSKDYPIIKIENVHNIG